PTEPPTVVPGQLRVGSRYRPLAGVISEIFDDDAPYLGFSIGVNPYPIGVKNLYPLTHRSLTAPTQPPLARNDTGEAHASLHCSDRALGIHGLLPLFAPVDWLACGAGE